MAISFGVVEAGTNTGNGVNPTLSPASISSDSNSFNILLIGWKSSSIAEPSVSSSTGKWIRLGFSDSVTDVATGADVGSTSTLAYYSKGTCPTGTTIQFTGTVGSCAARTFNVQKSSSESWVYSYAIGSDESYGANFSANNYPNFFTVANDFIVCGTITNTDAATYTSPAFVATGITFSSVTNRFDTVSGAGDDLQIRLDTATTSSGTQTDVFRFDATNASSSQGTTIAIRLRVLANPTLSILAISEFAQTAGYQLTASGLSPYTQFKIDATNGTTVWPVRGANLQLVTAGSFVGYDFEFPFGTTSQYGSSNITYTVTTYLDGQEAAIVSTVTSQTPYAEWAANLAGDSIPTALGPRSYLGVPRTPALNIPVFVQEYDGYSRSGRVLSKSEVLGRANPVVSVDVTSGRTGSFTLLVPPTQVADIIGTKYVPDDIKSHMDILEGGYVYLLRTISPYSAGFEDLYFTIDTLAVKRLNRYVNMTDSTFAPVMQIEVSFTEVDSPPASDSVTIVTWQDILDTYTAWQGVKDSNADWLGVLQNG